MGDGELTQQQRRWIEHVLPRVHAIARSLRSRMSHLTEDDLVSAGYEGLIQAAQRYDPSAGVPFPAFANYRIRGAMLDAARRALPSIRQRSRAMRALEATQAILQAAQTRENATSPAETASLRQRVETASELVARATTAVLVSRLAPQDPDSIGDRARDAEVTLLDEETKARVLQAIGECSEDDQALLRALYFDALSMRELAERLGKSTSTVSRHHARIIGALSRKLRRDGYP